MSRPDARLLVPVACLPVHPKGAQVVKYEAWHDRWLRGFAADRATDGSFYTIWDDGRMWYERPSDLSIDLSAPALRDGVPERLDALPWALGLLRRGVNGVHMMNENRSAVLTDYGDPVLAFNDPMSPNMRCTIDEDLTPWPDLSGLSDDDAARAVVASALRGAR